MQCGSCFLRHCSFGWGLLLVGATNTLNTVNGWLLCGMLECCGPVSLDFVKCLPRLCFFIVAE